MFPHLDSIARYPGRQSRILSASVALVCAASFYLPAGAATREIVEDFSVSRPRPTTAAVWNISRRSLHLPLVIDRSKGLGGNPADPVQEDELLDLGDGSDGRFESSRYAVFDVNGGVDPNTVTLDTSRNYRFSDFDLAPGVTLRALGSVPLRIRVQGDVTIAGQIDLSGRNGLVAQPNPSTVRLGGASSAGGGNGGNGGDPIAPLVSTAGQSAFAGGAGLGGATAAGGSAPGGSGGGNKTAGTAGANGGPAGGSLYGDDYIISLLGGSGGGGGGAQTPSNAYGASGGGGGGALEMQIGGDLTVTNTGSILATGGNGGGTNATSAGPGGGGSGGALRFLLGGTFLNDGVLDAIGGSGGNVGGGDGSNGRIWVGNTTGTLQGSGAENPPPPATPMGQSFYTLQPVVAVSETYDTGNSRPHYKSIEVQSLTPGGSTATVEVAGSDDAFMSDNTGYVPIADTDRLENKRYFRLRFRLNAGDRTSTPEIRQVTVSFEERIHENFDFGWAGCARVHPESRSTPRGRALGSLLAMISLFTLPWLGRRLRG